MNSCGRTFAGNILESPENFRLGTCPRGSIISRFNKYAMVHKVVIVTFRFYRDHVSLRSDHEPDEKDYTLPNHYFICKFAAGAPSCAINTDTDLSTEA